MKKWIPLALMLCLLSPLAGHARRHKADASPTPVPSPTATPQSSDKQSLELTATLLASFETKNTDGDARRDVTVVIDGLANPNNGSIKLTPDTFVLKDPRTGNTYAGMTTNNTDINGETTIGSSDGTLESFKVYFDVPGDLRPNKLYVRVGNSLESYPLGK